MRAMKHENKTSMDVLFHENKGSMDALFHENKACHGCFISGGEI